MATLTLSNSNHNYKEPLSEKEYLKIQSYILSTFNYTANSPERIDDFNKLLDITNFDIFTDNKVARELVGLIKKTNDKQCLELFKCISNREEFFKTNKNGVNLSNDVFYFHLGNIENHLHLRKANDLSKYIFKLGIQHHYVVETNMLTYLSTTSYDRTNIMEKTFFPLLSFFYFYPNHKLMGAWQLLEENKDELIANGQALKSFSNLRGHLEEKSSNINNWEKVEVKLATIEKDLLDLTLSYQETLVAMKSKKNKI